MRWAIGAPPGDARLEQQTAWARRDVLILEGPSVKQGTSRQHGRGAKALRAPLRVTFQKRNNFA